MSQGKPKEVELRDHRSFTTKEQLMEELAELPDGALIYQRYQDEERALHDRQLEAASTDFREIKVVDTDIPWTPRKGPFLVLCTVQADSQWPERVSERGQGKRSAWLWQP